MSDRLQVAPRASVAESSVPRLYYAALAAATSSSWALILGPALATLPRQVDGLDRLGRISALALVTGSGGAVAIVSILIVGRLSDITRSRWGSRQPLIFAGMLLVVPVALATGSASSVTELAVWWSVLQVVINMLLSPVMATIPDFVPERHQGAASSCLAISGAVGPILGTAVDVVASGVIPAYVILGSLAVVSHTLLLLTLRCTGVDDSMVQERVEVIRREPKSGFNFSLAWLHRFLFALGQNLSVPFIYFYLQDVVHYAQHHPGDTNTGVLITTAIYGPCVIASAIIAGIVSDRTHRRKIYIVGATGMFAIGVWLAAWTSDWNGVLVLSALTGLGFGAYEATSMALVMRLLPNVQRRARDLGVIHAATLIAIAVGPVAAAPLITGFGYATTYVISGAAVLLSGIVSLSIRGIR